MLDRRSIAIVAVALWGVAGLQAADPNRREAHPFFGLTKVHPAHLTLTADNYQRIQPPPGGPRFGALFDPDERAREANVDSHRSQFGMEFPYAHASLEIAGQSFPDLAIRYKGNGTFAMAGDRIKKPFKVDFDRYNDKQSFHGLKALSLNNSSMDDSFIREALAYKVFAAAGVPSPRTAFVEVTVTVPGKYDRTTLGLYLAVENIDKNFLKDHYGSSKGLLLKPERVADLQPRGDTFDLYVTDYQPKTEASDKDGKRLIAFTKLIHRADDATFNREIGNYLDVDAFARFLAATVVTACTDSFLTLGHNFYVYLNPKTNKFHFLPWDLDLAFGNFFIMGSGDELAKLSLMKPYQPRNKLIERFLAIPEYAEIYKGHCKTVAAIMAKQVPADLPAVQAAVRDAAARDKKAMEERKETPQAMLMMGFKVNPVDIGKFVVAREKSVAEQIAGKDKGFTPRNMFGLFDPFGKPLRLALDKDKNETVSREEWAAAAGRLYDSSVKDKTGDLRVEELGAGLNKVMPKFPMFGGPPPKKKDDPSAKKNAPPPPPAPPTPPVDTGLEMAKKMFKKAGAVDGRLTRKQYDQAASKLFDELDRDKGGTLEDGELSGGVIRFLPMPGPGAPAPKAKPPEKKK